MKAPSWAEPTVALDDCDKEPIHIPGSVQPHGVLFSVDESDLTIVQVSVNVVDWFGSEAHRWIGEPLTKLFDPVSIALLERALATDRPEAQNPLRMTAGSRAIDGIIHRHRGATILEIEPASEVPGDTGARPPHVLNDALAQLETARSLPRLYAAAASGVRQLTSFDRVMVYRFDMDGHGEVIAEEKSEDLEPFLGLHYPASDIPRQARELYLHNWLRIIPDAEYEPQPILPTLEPETGEPLDLTYAVLRSVSPVHLEYLRNMGVRASMSISLVVGGSLWGLISCASRAPTHVAHTVRVACELLGRITSLQIAAQEKLDEEQCRAARSPIHAKIASRMAAAASPLDGLVDGAPSLLDLIAAGGAATHSNGSSRTVGRVPSDGEIRGIVEWLRQSQRAEVYSTNALPCVHPPAHGFKDVASGLLAIALPKPSAEYVLWFRPEVVETVHWGGDPNKAVDVQADLLLHPRRSFELWKEELCGTSTRWKPTDIEAAAELRRKAIEIELGRQVERERAARAEAQRATERRDDFLAIVSHDLRNPLSVIQMSAATLATLVGGTGLLAERAAAPIERCCRAARDMEELIRDLLDVATIDSGGLGIEARPEAVVRILCDSLDRMKPLAEQRGILLDMAPPASEIVVLSDRHRLVQVLSNLIGNAIHHTPAGGSIRLAVEATSDRARFSVIDSGIGMSPEQLEHIFERFWQGRLGAFGGAGLGLYIARRIIEAHGGEIMAESEPGKGTTFHFTLPVVDAPAEGRAP